MTRRGAACSDLCGCIAKHKVRGGGGVRVGLKLGGLCSPGGVHAWKQQHGAQLPRCAAAAASGSKSDESCACSGCSSQPHHPALLHAAPRLPLLLPHPLQPPTPGSLSVVCHCIDPGQVVDPVAQQTGIWVMTDWIWVLGDQNKNSRAERIDSTTQQHLAQLVLCALRCESDSLHEGF